MSTGKVRSLVFSFWTLPSVYEYPAKGSATASARKMAAATPQVAHLFFRRDHQPRFDEAAAPRGSAAVSRAPESCNWSSLPFNNSATSAADWYRCVLSLACSLAM